jgi:hypothetical protein
MESRSRNHCCGEKAISTTYSERPSVVLVMQHAENVHRVILSPAVSQALQYCSTLSKKRHDFRKRGTEYKMCTLVCPSILVKTFLILEA